MGRRKSEMDVGAYERGVPDLPQRLRVYAMAHKNVELTLTHEQALLLADDLERGIATREVDFKGLQTAMADLADATGGREPALAKAANLLGSIFGRVTEIRGIVSDQRWTDGNRNAGR